MKITTTGRGFALVEFNDGNGVKCSLQKSSAAERDMVWLGCNEPSPKVCPGDGTGWHPYPVPDNVQCDTRMHLAREQVAALLPALHSFVNTGEIDNQSPSPHPVIEEYDAIVDGILPEIMERDGTKADFVMRVCDYQLLRAAALTNPQSSEGKENG